MEIFLVFICVIVLLPIVLGPFAVKASHWVSRNITIQPVSPETLDLEVRAFLEHGKLEFEAMGFEFVDYLSLTEYMPNLSTWFALFVEQKTKTFAMAAVIRQKTGKTVAYYEFTTKYSNGRVINVNNSPLMGSYTNPDKSTYRYPKVASVKELLDIHRWAIAHDKRAGDPVAYDKGKAVDTLTEALKQELELQRQIGYYGLSEGTGRYVLTWKGAFVMTEKNVFPIKNILGYLDLQASRKVIEGMYAQPVSAAARTGREPAKAELPGAGLKSEEQFKGGAGWFYWIAGLSLINSLAVKLGLEWNFIIGLGITQLLDSIALSAGAIAPDTAFQAFLLAMDIGFVALFVAFGVMAQKRHADSYEVGMVVYAIDSLVFLLFIDIVGILFHGIALFFLFRGWRGLRRLQQGPARTAV